MHNTYFSIMTFFLDKMHLERLINAVLNTYMKEIVQVSNLNVFYHMKVFLTWNEILSEYLFYELFRQRRTNNVS